MSGRNGAGRHQAGLPCFLCGALHNEAERRCVALSNGDSSPIRSGEHATTEDCATPVNVTAKGEKPSLPLSYASSCFSAGANGSHLIRVIFV
jgi:hypothetical protein